MATRFSRSLGSLKPRRASGLLALILLASVLVPAPSVGAQSTSVECLGFTAQSAAAAGFIIHLGTEGDDVLAGSDASRDFMLGFGGDDRLTGNGSDDIICGGSGDDVINAGDGNDRVHGNRGNDTLTLGAGNDRASGGFGGDSIVGGAGVDRIAGQAGGDHISGGLGDDFLEGGDGPDVIFGGNGNDQVRGNVGNDRLAGGPGSDVVAGGNSKDNISGGEGNDTIRGGHGDDSINGDAGSDLIDGGVGLDGCIPDASDSISGCESEGVAPEPEPEPAPPTGGPVPASEAPQGVNQFGWPLLTQVGLDALLFCESTNNHAINTGNGFFGGVQWLPATWNAAARLIDRPEFDGVLPHLVPAAVQDEATFAWWEATRPNTQWPVCHARALEAMNVLAP